jgi:hypothetical protein
MLTKENLIEALVKEKCIRRYPTATFINVSEVVEADETEREDFYGQVYDFVVELSFGEQKTVSQEGRYVYISDDGNNRHIVRLFQQIDEF